ncbi:MAG TPA: DEAD/DEAH box helicase [Methanocorpusculum sp.]|nr:DEAD/DEAH box helicase [Methanocorpusculum sp.]
MNLFPSLHPTLQELLLTGLGWDNLRPVQEETFISVSSGADTLVIAPTAGGKTEAAFFPVIDAILKNPSESLSVIYVSPLKALINDQLDRITFMCERTGLGIAVQHGDVSARDRFDFSKSEHVDILLTTPESLEVLLSDAKTKGAFANVRYIIIDEIHAFMESDRGVHLRCLMDRLELLRHMQIIRIGLSATVGNPEDLLMWFSGSNRKNHLVRIPSPPAKKQFAFVVEQDFSRQVQEIVKAVSGKKALLFTDSRSLAERLIGPLRAELPSVFIHHSSVSPEGREEAELSFKKNSGTCVICTSTMELGIDISELDIVVQYGAPRSVSSFLQRLGRTGRRGNPARMTFVVANACDLLTTVSVIEAAMNHAAESLQAPVCPYHVLIQQLFLLMKGKAGLGLTGIILSLRALTPFRDIPLSHFSAILDYLVRENYLTRSGDLYIVGTKAEKELGRSNWIALISVIPDSGGYLAVLPDGTIVGTLDPRFVGGEPGKTFSFTGKTWRLLHRDDAHKRALIEPASAKGDLKRPFWSGGDGGSYASRLVCKSVAATLERGRPLLPLPLEQKEMIDGLIRRLPDDFSPGKIHIRTEPELKGYSVVVSTFLGTRTNQVLAHLLKNRLDGKHSLRSTQFAIRIFDWDSPHAGEIVAGILEELGRVSVISLAEELPRLPETTWKFGELLTEELRLEMAARDYYDIPGLLTVLSVPPQLSR